MRGDFQKDRVGTRAPLNTSQSRSSTDRSPPLRARVLITLVKAEKASAPPTFFEQCDTFRAITAPRSAL